MKNLEKFGIYKGEGRHHEEIMYTIALIYSLISTQLAQFLKDYNLTLGKLNILIALRHHGGEAGIRQVDVSKHLIVTPSNMTKMIDKLETEGLVTRSALEGDRRVNIVKVTPDACVILDRLWPEYTKRLKQAVSGLPEQKQQVLASLLTEWFETLH